MATLKKTPNAQTVLAAEFTFDNSTSDAMVNTSGASVAFNAAAATTYDVMTLPQSSLVIGGDIEVLTAGVGPATMTISVGDATSATRYANGVDLKTKARTALTLTPYKTTTESIRLTIANADATDVVCKAKVSVLFIVDNRATENLKTT